MSLWARRAVAVWFLLWVIGPAGPGFSATTQPSGTSLHVLRGVEKELVTLVEELGRSVVAVTAWRRSPWMGNGPNKDNVDEIAPVRGSGFIISDDGQIVTNEHVIGRAELVRVTLWTGKEYSAKLVGSDSRSDLAVIKIDEKGLPVARLGRLDRVRRGQWVVAMGNPFGMADDGQASASLGIVSAIGRHVPYKDGTGNRYYGNLIQTTAQITVGNSGGPLFNLDGEVIAINAIIPTTKISGTQHIAFAIPICPWTRWIIDKLRSGQSVDYGYVGVSLRDLPGQRGAMVCQVAGDSPASKAGITGGDVVVEYDGTPVRNVDHLIMLISQTALKTVKVKIRRQDKSIVKTVGIARRVARRVISSQQRPARATPSLPDHEQDDQERG